MSDAKCRNCGCPTPEVVEIPGAPGVPGAPGTAGINAYTLTTADFTVPAINGNVAVAVANNSWMAVGENVFIPGAGIFSVASLSGTNSATLTYLNYNGNVNAGNSIGSGSLVTPSGVQPNVTLLPAQSFYALAGAQAVTATPGQALGATLTLAAGTYLIFATARYDYVGATFDGARTITTKVRRTNNTAGDIPNSIENFVVEQVTTKTFTAMLVALPPVTYAAGAGDIIQVFCGLDVLPTAGALNIVEVSLFALKLF